MIFGIVVGCAILADIITGFVKAWANHALDSKILRKGLLHKFSEIFLAGISYGAEYATKYISLDISIPLYSAVCSYIILMEIISVFENLIAINPDLGKFIGKYLDSNKSKKGDRDNDEFSK